MTAPEEIHGVSTSIFSIARYYGGCKAFDATYTYDPIADVLIRDDVLAKREKLNREETKRKRDAAKALCESQQPSLFGGLKGEY